MLFSNLSIILKKIIIPHFVQRPRNVYKLVKNYKSIKHDWEKSTEGSITNLGYSKNLT